MGNVRLARLDRAVAFARIHFHMQVWSAEVIK